ncbi:hypothetical protein Plhal304r1_c016g0057751 [Plasmopara halstedii]
MFLAERTNVAYRCLNDKLIDFTWGIFAHICRMDCLMKRESVKHRGFVNLTARFCSPIYAIKFKNGFARSLCFEVYMNP